MHSLRQARHALECSLMVLFLLAGLLAARPVAASTVMAMEFTDVAAEAELIFEGRVIDIEARENEAGRIHTWVRFEVRDVLKGDYAGDRLELRYLGGERGGRHMEVTDMQQPRGGESGIYFVESLANDLIHPLVGWSQGHYLIETDDSGVRRVNTAAGRPVSDVAADGRDDGDRGVFAEQGDAAGGVITAPLNTPGQALRVDDFKAAVERALDAR